jgi:NAD(P)-dependent dehydrogenase (short-subunit alcohol dehydrogenase family)
MDLLAGRVAVVTGAASGIGRAMAKMWAAEGMHVVLADIDLTGAKRVENEIGASGGEALAVECDVSRGESVERLAERVYSEFGATNVLCNNAGILFGRRLVNCSLDDWNRVLGVNLWGAIHGVHAFLPRILAQDSPAHIVNTASAAALAQPQIGGALYQASKAGVVAFSEVLRLELEPAGIGVTVVCPGPTDTPMLDRARRPARAAPSASDAPQAMNPTTVATLTRDAVLDGRLYVNTHRSRRDGVLRRHADLIESFAYAAP